MNRETALRLLRDVDPDQRWLAARFFVVDGAAPDQEVLQRALHTEGSVWVRNALRRALRPRRARSYHPVAMLDETSDQPVPDAAITAEFAGRVRLEEAKAWKHEVLTPLDRYLRTLDVEESLTVSTREVIRELRRLRSRCEALVKVASATSDIELEPFDLQGLVEQVRDHHPGGSIIHAHGPRATVLSDRSCMQLVIETGLNNAVEAVRRTDERGRVRITWDVERAPAAMLEIIDDGPGLPAAPHKVLQMGFTTKHHQPEQHGVGLGVARRVIRTLGGDLGVSDAHGGGARFWVTWPN